MKEITRENVFFIAEQFARRVKSELDSEAVLYLFGSYARNDANGESDIDIAVVSRKFGEDISEDYGRLAVLAHHVDFNIEAHPIVLEDWIETTPFTHEIKKDGVLV